MVRYRGWIPNKTGKLSFSQIGKQSPNNVIFETESECNNNCSYLVAQNRLFKLDDTALNYYSRYLRPLNLVEDVIFTISAKSRKRRKNSDYLIGQVWCKLGNVNEDTFLNNIGSCEKVFSASYVVHRKGACKIHNVEFGPDINFNGPESDAKEWIASQTYMFLKDILHRHKHHPESSDTFIDLKAVSDGSHWKRYVAYNLGKMAIKGPDVENPITFKNTIGVISYLESLLESFKIDDIYTNKNIEAWKSSLEAEHSNITFQIGGRRWIGGAIMAIISFIGSWLHWKDLSKWTEWNLIYLAAYLAILYGVFQYAHIYSAIGNRQRLTDILKIASYNRLLSSIILIIIACVILWIM